MSILNQPSLTDGSHLNRGLFSDYYLNHIVPENPQWVLDGARELREDLRQMLARLQPDQLNEAQLEEQWVQPVLERLGHHYAVQVRIRYRDSGRRIPDYLLMASPEDARAITTQTYTPPEIAHALGVADAKAWGTRLDQASQEYRNPSHQIDEYLRFSELKWGILTDGRYWRLYERSSSKNNVYYAVDLVDLLNQQNAEPFLYFYLFFRREAFIPGGWLDRILEGSHEYAEKISDDLEDQVYDALQVIAQGFLDYRRNRLSSTPSDLRLIYENSLIFLYRLLFVLYTESRGILPLLQNDEYRRQYSLLAIKQRVAELAVFERRLSRDSGELYVRLNDLFYIIDVGNPDFAMPAYNGHLFSEESHRFLDEKKIGDPAFVRAVNLLTQPKTGPRRKGGDFIFIDYRDLTERHLGAIYEKLLDYELAIAEVPLVERNNKWVPAKDGETPDVPAGKVYLRTGSNERKITGSYYTPDYIVRFIVERTLEPLLTRITEGYATRDAEGNWEVQPDQADALRDAILKINVLDPAIGSGHFLVDVVAYIAEWLRGLKLLPEDMASEEDELAYWKRQVVTACIYGVDVNPLAVELAKLSLWLATVAQGKPLSFLDHHIRVGNSLVGTRLSEMTLTLSAGDPLMGEFDAHIGTAVRAIRRIETTIADHVSDVKQQEATYQTAFEDLIAWHHLANVWTAHRLGLPLNDLQWESLRNHLLYQLPLSAEAAAILEQAQAMAESGFYFHWDLTFPEIFFDENGKPLSEPGFDAVIGNPPYVRQEAITSLKSYLQGKYDVYQGTADLYVYFYNQGLRMVQRGGLMSFITANKWFKAGYGEPLRKYLSESGEVQQIIDFGHAPIFRGADTFPCIVVVAKPQDKPSADAQAIVTEFPRHMLQQISLKQYATENHRRIPISRFGAAAWSLEPPALDALMEKIRQAGTPLSEFIAQTPYRGVLTGLNEAFLIDTSTKERLIREDPRSADIIKPYLRGQDIKRWSPEWGGLWMILLKSSENQDWVWANAGENAEVVFSQHYPALYRHMKGYEDRLRNRQDQGHYWWELRSCAYYNVFENPKIIHADITWRPQFAFHEESTYLVNTAYVWGTTDFYALAVVNSPLLWTYMWRSATHGKDEALRLIYSFVETIPIAQPSEVIRAEVEPAVKRLIELTQQRQQAVKEFLDWLKVEYNIASPGRNLEAFASLSEDAFVEAVRDRRPRSAGSLTPAGLRTLRETFQQYSGQVQAINTESHQLESRLSDLVNQAYGLTPEEIDLMWRTAPPRMPLASPLTDQ